MRAVVWWERRGIAGAPEVRVARRVGRAVAGLVAIIEFIVGGCFSLSVASGGLRSVVRELYETAKKEDRARWVDGVGIAVRPITPPRNQLSSVVVVGALACRRRVVLGIAAGRFPRLEFCNARRG